MRIASGWPRVFASLFLCTLFACSTSGPTSGPTRSEGARACGKVQAPRLLERVTPPYPDDLRKRGVRGKVILKARLLADGELENIKVSSSPSPRLSDLAVEAFRKWRYKPAVCGGKPMPVYITATLTFGAR